MQNAKWGWRFPHGDGMGNEKLPIPCCSEHQAWSSSGTSVFYSYLSSLILCSSSSQAGMEVDIVANGGTVFFTIPLHFYDSVQSLVRIYLYPSITQLRLYCARQVILASVSCRDLTFCKWTGSDPHLSLRENPSIHIHEMVLMLETILLSCIAFYITILTWIFLFKKQWS